MCVHILKILRIGLPEEGLTCMHNNGIGPRGESAINLPSRYELVELLGSDDFYIWEYYGRGALDKTQAWIFRSRLSALMTFLSILPLRARVFLDVGCGAMFVAYALITRFSCEYIGVDTMPIDKLRKYRDAMRNIGAEAIEAVRSSAESLPFRKGAFDFVLSFDLLEHLSRPNLGVMELRRVAKNKWWVAISLPLEGVFQKLLRIGFFLLKISGNPFLKKVKNVGVTRTPEYHYRGEIKSYNGMLELLEQHFKSLDKRFTPLGSHKSINVNAVHLFQRRE